MKITRELLERYHAGACSEKEKLAVERWLFSPKDKTDRLNDTFLKRVETDIWNSLAPFIDHQPVKVVPVHKKIIFYLTAACIAFMLFGTGYLLASRGADQQISFTAKEIKGQLHISNRFGKTTKLTGERYDISFQGVLHLYNASMAPVVVHCGEKNFVLKPSEIYYLYGSDEHPSIVSESKLMAPDSFAHNLVGNFMARTIEI